jgi:flagellar biosynthesis regulator FlaF
LKKVNEELMIVVPSLLERRPPMRIRLGEALVRNQAIWSAMVLKVRGSESRLSDDMHALLANLYIYVEANSKWLLAGDENGDLEMLIMINRNVISSLQLTMVKST